MHTLSNLSIRLAEQAVPVAIIAAIIVAILAFIMIVLNLSARSRSMPADDTVRSGENEDLFVHSLLIYGFDPDIARSTFRYLQEKQRPSSPVRAFDLLDKDLHLGHGEVEQSLHVLLRLNGRSDQHDASQAPLTTVQDLVCLIQSTPRLKQFAI